MQQPQVQDIYAPMEEGELERLSVDELVQRLEAMEKNNEQIKRENQLFESYLLRKSKEERRTDDDAKNAQKQKNKMLANSPQKLSPEQKYEIASQELETLKSNIEEGRDKSETLLERLKAILEGTDLSIAEIRKEAFDFGRFLSAAENGRIGKYDAEKLSKYMVDKLKQKEALIDKLQSKNLSLKVQILKAETQIKHKDEMGDELKFIDFHQLQIENKKHVKDIDERNRKMMSLKLNSTNTQHSLTNLKKKLTAAELRQKEIDTQMDIKLKMLVKKKNDVEDTLNAIALVDKSNRTENARLNEIKNMPNPLKFVHQKNDEMKLVKKVKNWERKIEIAELEAKRARAVLKQRDIQNAQNGNAPYNQEIQFEP